VPVASHAHQVFSQTGVPNLDSPLARAAIVRIAWDLTEPQLVTSLAVALRIAGLDYSFSFDKAHTELGFCLPEGLTLAAVPTNLEVKITVNGDTAHEFSGILPIEKPSAPVPDPESARSVYTENQTELRRTRTLYESLVITVTVGFAILIAQAHALTTVPPVGRGFLAIGILLLTVIVVFLVKEMAARYYGVTRTLQNFELAFGVKDGPWTGELLRYSDFSISDPETRPHWLWALLITLYLVVLSVASIWILLVRSPSAWWSVPLTGSVAILLTEFTFSWLFDDFWSELKKLRRYKTFALGYVVLLVAFAVPSSLYLNGRRVPVGVNLDRHVTTLELGGLRYGAVAANVTGNLGDVEQAYLMFQPSAGSSWVSENASLVNLRNRPVLIFPLGQVMKGAQGKVSVVLVVPSRNIISAQMLEVP